MATIRADVAAVHGALTPLVPHPVGDGEVWRLAEGESRPVEWHQTWMLDESTKTWRVDVMTEPGDTYTWVYRRDPRITAPRGRMIGRTDSGLLYLRPHGVLLYKASRTRPKDEADFRMAAAQLTIAERAWLSEALATVHPGHPWIRRLAAV
jgi:hypothetical protein